MLLIFIWVFSIPVISWIESIGVGGQDGGDGRWGWVGSRRQIKATIRTQETVGLIIMIGNR